MALNNLNQDQARTREEYKKIRSEAVQKRTNLKKKAETVENPRVRIRLIPIWLRLILLIVFMFVSLIVGAVVGYGVLGSGKVTDVFKESTWTHIIDLVDKEK